MSIYIGKSVTATWGLVDWVNPDDEPLEVKIELSRDDGSTWETVVARTTNNNTYTWTLTGAGTPNAKLKISDPDVLSVNFVTAAFPIDYYPTEEMVAPVVYGGPATWGPGGVGFGPGTYAATAAIAAYQAANNSAPTNGNASLVLGDSCKVAGVTYNGNVPIPPFIPGLEYIVKWDNGDWSDYIPELIKIIYSIDDFNSWVTVVIYEPNTEIYRWVVGDDLGVGSSNGKIRVSDNADDNYYIEQGPFDVGYFPTEAGVIGVDVGGPEAWGLGGELGPGTAVAATSNSSTSFSPSSCSDSSNSFSDSSCSDSSRSVASTSDSSDSFSIVVTTGTDSIQAQITKNIKACLKGITVANGFNYDVAMVEESRKLLDISDRWPYILLLENEPEKDDEGLVIRELSYVVWFFSKQDDRVISDPADASKDVDTEIAYYNRNAIPDITKALNADIYRGYVDGTANARAEITEVLPGTHDLYVDETMVMFGTWCAVRVVTNIDATNPYQLRNGI